MARRLTVILAVIILAACSSTNFEPTKVLDNGVVVYSGLAYGDQRRQHLDIYQPKSTSAPLPTVVFFYGGAWEEGDREEYAYVGRALAAEGFLVAIPDYRLYPNVRFPVFLQDGAKAVRWVLEHAASFGGQSDNLHLMGHSAGAYITSMLAMNGAYLKAAGTDRSILGPWVALSGPHALYPMEISYVRPIFEGHPNSVTRPIVFANNATPPALLLHGRADTTVHPDNSSKLAAALTKAGASAKAILYSDVTHMPMVKSLASPNSEIAPTLPTAVAFFRHRKLP